METWLSANSAWLYGATPLGAALLLAVLERFLPSRTPILPTMQRWLLHGFLTAFTDAASTFIFRVGAVGIAFSMQGSQYGVLNRAGLPLALAIPLTFLVMDLFQYGSHYARHAVPLLWRFHKVHHSDRDVDFSTGLRFHPGEILLTQGFYLLAIAVLSPPVIAVILYELVNTAEALFSHANLRLSRKLEKLLRPVLVTPSFHRTHHSIHAAEQQSNFAVLFSFWDHLFHTYRERPQAERGTLELGLDEITEEQSFSALAMLKLPFITRQATATAEDVPARALASK